MTNIEVIKMRDGLKAGCNWPLKVYADNTTVIIDESNMAAFTKWDDDNEILYYFRLADPISSRQWQNTPPVISVTAVRYLYIQYMEAVPFPVVKLDDVMDSIESTGATAFSPEFREKIKHVFEKLNDPKLVELYPELVNAIHGLQETDIQYRRVPDYYSGKPDGAYFQETAYTRRYNEELAKTKAFQKQREEALAGGGE